MKHISLRGMLLLLVLAAVGRGCDVDWVGQEGVNALIIAQDGGFLLVGDTDALGTGSMHMRLVKTNAAGEELWARTYPRWGVPRGAVETSDAGIAVTGWSPGPFLVKADGQGNELWGTTYDDIAATRAVAETSDGGFVLAGAILGVEDEDMFLLRADAAGQKLWSRTYGGPGSHEGALAVVPTHYGFLVAGYRQSPGQSHATVFVVKTAPDGDILLGGPMPNGLQDEARALARTADGGLVLAGAVRPSEQGDNSAIYVLRTDSGGALLWLKTFGFRGRDVVHAVAEAADGGIVFAGDTVSGEGDQKDMFLIKTDVDGDLLWMKTYGGRDWDSSRCLAVTPDGGYAIAGHTYSFGVERSDMFLVKTDGDGNQLWSRTYHSRQH